MLRELGGVLGISVLASVFARQGVYDSPRVFINGFTQALWVGVGLSAIGCRRRSSCRPADEPLLSAPRPCRSLSENHRVPDRNRPTNFGRRERRYL
jgi:hypothetical protein